MVLTVLILEGAGCLCHKHITMKYHNYTIPSTFDGDIGPAYALTVIGISPGLFFCFKLLLSALPCDPGDPGSRVFFLSVTSGDQGPLIQGGVALSTDPMSGTKQLSVKHHMISGKSRLHC